eukprot:1671661-Amphidinium_carterae.1
MSARRHEFGLLRYFTLPYCPRPDDKFQKFENEELKMPDIHVHEDSDLLTTITVTWDPRQKNMFCRVFIDLGVFKVCSGPEKPLKQ